MNEAVRFSIFIEFNNFLMITSQLKNKATTAEGSETSEDRQWFTNPISKNTFEALPKIYGTRKKKKLSVRR
jgi:hypothetical protein